MDLVTEVLKEIDELKRDISAIEIASMHVSDRKLKELSMSAVNILNVSIEKLRNIFDQVQKEEDVKEIIGYVHSRSEEMTEIVLGKISDFKNGTDYMDTVKINHNRKDKLNDVSGMFARNEEEKEKETLIDNVYSSLKPVEEEKEEEKAEIPVSASESLKSWLMKIQEDKGETK